MLGLGLKLPKRKYGSIAAPSGYSPTNLYTEASAVNADNYVAGIGSWTRQNNSSIDSISATIDSPIVTNGSPGSIRLNRVAATNFERLNLDWSKVGVGDNLIIGQNYRVRFYYKRIVGSTVAGTGMRLRVSQGVDLDNDITEANTGIWTYFTSDIFNADVIQPAIWIVGSWGVTADDDFYVSNFDLIPV